MLEIATIANEIYHFFEFLKKPFQNCSKVKETIAYVLIQIPKDGRTVVAWFSTSERFFGEKKSSEKTFGVV